MKKLVLVLLCSISLSFASTKSFIGLEGTLNVAGGTAHIKCEKEAIKNIMRKHSNISITIAGGGSGMGIKQVSTGLIDLANSGRKPTASEVEKGDLKIFRFAVDGIGIVINLYTRDESSATRKVFWKKALKKSDIAKSARVVSSNAAMKTAIKNDPNAIGILSLGLIDDKVKAISINGVFPSLENVTNSSYTVARGLYLLSSGEPKALAKTYIEYMRSPEGAKIVTKYGFIAVDK